MDNFEAYAPPKAVVADAQVEQPRIPLTFKILLIIFVVLHVLGSLVNFSGMGIVWGGVLAISSWKTLDGSRPASRVLGALLVLSAVMGLTAAVVLFPKNPFDSLVPMGIMLGMTAWLLVLAGFIYFHPDMQAAFRKSDAKKWSGG